jgi:hypothetical protein
MPWTWASSRTGTGAVPSPTGRRRGPGLRTLAGVRLCLIAWLAQASLVAGGALRPVRAQLYAQVWFPRGPESGGERRMVRVDNNSDWLSRRGTAKRLEATETTRHLRHDRQHNLNQTCGENSADDKHRVLHGFPPSARLGKNYTTSSGRYYRPPTPRRISVSRLK